MLLKEAYLTKNACYIAGAKHIPKGIMWHSTGANNPNLARYIPDDGIVGPNRYNNHWDVLMPGGIKVCVHAFIGLDKDGVVRTYNTLPWDIECWGSGVGYLGKEKNANNTGYLQFEICEDGLTDINYFNKVYKEALELSAMLCKKYNIPVDKITCHSEGNDHGIASNHSDVEHWFTRFGKSMDDVRADVENLLHPEVVVAPKPLGVMYRVIIDEVQVMALSSLDSAKAEVMGRIDRNEGKAGKVNRNTDGATLFNYVKPVSTAPKVYELHIQGQAVKNLQKAVNKYAGRDILEVDGFYGENTRDKVPNNIHHGEVANIVLEIQTRLTRLGFYSGSLDKSFGDKTKKAVIAFQKSRRIDSDGVVGRTTFSELYKK